MTPEAGRPRSPDPYRDQMLRRVVARAPIGLALFLVCVALSTLFEMLRFPERRGWMGAFAAGFVALAAVCWGLVRRRPAWTVYVLIGFVNVIGVALNTYHVIVGASVAMCIWTLTGLLASSALILPWGSTGQALASVGALLSYPLHLEAGTVDPLTWSAGAAYLLVVVTLGVSGASLFTRYVRGTLQLSAVLSEREARLQTYFDLSLVGTAILAPQGTIIEVNDELCRMFGYARGELLGLSWRALLHPRERAAVGALLRRTLSGSGEPERREMPCVRKDGGSIRAQVSIRGLPGSQGLVDHVMILVEDVTERRRMEAEREGYLARAETARRRAEDASHAKDAFLASVSHELRTPLTPILAWSNLLRRGGLDGQKTTAALAAIERNAKTQAHLIEDLLDVSRVVSGEWRLALRPVQPAPIVQAAVEVMQPAAEAKGVTIATTLEPLAATVRGDPDRFQQVVTNLISNAVKFTPPGGRVEVALAQVGSRVRITVRDTGEGIDPGVLPHVFERFRQGDSSATRRHGGLGLGLAIVRELVEAHAGTVRAESAGVGLGALFTVELPLLAEGTAAIGPMPGRDAVPRLALDGLRILAVDDDPEATAAVAALLESCGALVRTAQSAAEALDVAAQWRPDVLVSDIAMPEEDGCALLQKLRAHGGSLGTIPAIALTAHAGAADRSRLFAAGFREHVAKPCDLVELVAAVERAAAEAQPPSMG